MSPTTEAPGIITADSALTVREFRRRTGLQQYAFTQARKAGLRVVELGRKRYVLGSDWLKFLRQEAEKQEAPSA